MKKRVLSLVLVLVLILSLAPLGAFAADTKTTITITSQPTNVFIPEGQDAKFTVSAVASSGTVQYAWIDADKINKDSLNLTSIMNIITAVSTSDAASAAELGIIGRERTLVIKNVSKSMNIACMLYVIKDNKLTSYLNGTNAVLFSDKVSLSIKTICATHSISTNLRRIDAIEPTCASEGRYLCYICTVCGTYYSDAYGYQMTTAEECIRSKLTSHSLHYYSGREGDCCTKSMKEYWQCTVCNKYFSNSAGTIETDVKALSLDGQIDPNRHSEANLIHYEAKPATCSYTGNSEYWFCTGCRQYFGDSSFKHGYSDNTSFVISKNSANHSALQEYAASEPGCTNEGNTHYWYCRGCNSYYANSECTIAATLSSTIIPATGHSFAWVPHYSGTSSDYHDYKCTKCGQWQKSGSHTGGAATCSSPAICSECGATYGAKDPTVHGRTIVKNKIEPTLTETGYSGDLCCEDCGVVVSKGEVLPNLCTHSEGGVLKLTHHEANAVSCLKNGNAEYWQCGICGLCFKTANAAGVGAAEESFLLPMTGHRYVERITNPVSCSEDGEKTFTCALCKDSYTEEIPATGHEFTTTVIKPGCIEEGFTYHSCKKCEYSFKDNIIPATGHSFNGWVTATAPKCTEKGTQERTCTVCGVTQTNDIDPLGHDFDDLDVCTRCGYSIHKHTYTDVITPPSCTEGGYTTHVCRCGDSYVDTPTQALGHNYGKWTVEKAASCTAPGSESRYCTRCTASETRFIAQLEHTYSEKIVEPTCAADGYTLHFCSCGDNYKTDFTGALGHDYGSWITVKGASCAEKGLDKRVCARCKAAETRENAALGHDLGPWVTEQELSCTQNGIERRYCLQCDYVETNEIKALGHDYSSWIVQTPASCTEIGMERCECSRCDAFKTREIGALGHSYGEWTTEKSATCTASGLERCDCTRCTEYKTREAPALGHNYLSWQAINPATCVTKGLERSDCARCHEYKTREVEPLGHDFGDWKIVKQATCTENGLEKCYCSRCSEFDTCELEPLGHTYGKWTSVKAASCTEEGSERCECIRCTAFQTRTVEPLSHSFSAWTVQTPAGCTVKGVEKCSCTRCPEYKTRDIEPLGHDYGEWMLAFAPTCTENGTEAHYCSRCDAFETRSVSALGHSIKSTVTDPTCTTAGYTTHYCVNGCGEVYVDSETPALGHKYVNGVCERCKESGSIDAPQVTAKNDAGTGRIVLTWDKVIGADEYLVYRATSKDGSYSQIAILINESYTNTTAEAGKTYYYKVTAVTYDGLVSPDSNIITRTCDCARPVISGSSSASSGKCILTWEPVEGAVKYEVYRATSKTGSFSKLGTTADTSYTNTSAKAGSTYYYKVRALGTTSSANSAYSEVISVLCRCAKPVVKGGNDATSGKCTLTWAAVDGASKYEVWRATSKTGAYKKMATVSGTSYTNTSATAGKTYYYKVKAICSKNSAADSEYSSVVTRTCDLAKTTARISLYSGKPYISWTEVEGASKYDIYRATSKNGEYTKVLTTAKTTYTNTGAKAGTTYYYKIVAVCPSTTAGNSAASNIVSIKATR